MSPKTWPAIGLILGSTIGGYIPALWGSSVLSLTSIMFGLIGGLAGIYLGFKYQES